jgi:glyoxylase-like metal-dependent hydrolase (beta-lactamase superfamily II)
MKTTLSFFFCFDLVSTVCLGQTQNFYEVYAIEYANRPAPVCAADIAVGGKATDSVRMSFYLWYLKGNNGRRVAVDAGYWEDLIGADTNRLSYRRPDIGLRTISVNPDSVTDLIITHTHWDHIDGIDLFPNATVWMQKKD